MFSVCFFVTRKRALLNSMNLSLLLLQGQEEGGSNDDNNNVDKESLAGYVAGSLAGSAAGSVVMAGPGPSKPPGHYKGKAMLDTVLTEYLSRQATQRASYHREVMYRHFN